MLHHKPEIAGAARSIRAPHSNGEASAPNLPNQHGPRLANELRAEGEAGFHPLDSVSPTFPCRACDGEGEAQYLALDESEYRWRTCHVCEGSRVEAPYCGVCQGSLTCDLYCTDCEEWAALTYVERISPTRVAL